MAPIRRLRPGSGSAYSPSNQCKHRIREDFRGLLREIVFDAGNYATLVEASEMDCIAVIGLRRIHTIVPTLASPLLGALSDRYGRRPILLLGFFGLAINFFATGLATSLWVLIAARLVGGAMQANAAVANAYVADITVLAQIVPALSGPCRGGGPRFAAARCDHPGGQRCTANDHGATSHHPGRQ